jgi:hypothetical protein
MDVRLTSVTLELARYPQRAQLIWWFDNDVRPLISHFAEQMSLPLFHIGPSGDVPLHGGDCLGKTDVMLATTEEKPICWSNVRVVGDLKSNADKSNLDMTVLQLANYAREVFGVQPCRHFVHSFTLCGSELRVWMFDRAGAYIIDIHRQPTLFVAVMLRYATMNAEEVGFGLTFR